MAKKIFDFWDEIIQKKNIEGILLEIEEKTDNVNFSKWKTIIVLGKTNEEYQNKELFYFNNVNMFVVFYLIDENKNKVFMNDSWIFALGNNYKKYVRKIDGIIRQ